MVYKALIDVEVLVLALEKNKSLPQPLSIMWSITF